MAVSLRLSRAGAKKAPFYHIVAADSRSPRDGSFLEAVGTYRPTSDELTFDEERVEKWLANGAQPTDTVRTLLRRYRKQKGATETGGTEASEG